MLHLTGTDEHIFSADVHDFEEKVIKTSHQKPVLVDLWAEWCSPCLVLAPILQKFIAECEGEVSLAKVEVDEGDGENMKLAGRYKVRGFPTVILFVDGEEKARFSGAKPLSFIRQFMIESINSKSQSSIGE
ncbi:MAG: thioredoxin domain-containing protein [Gammaproteobacteria bacterium]|nr:thioredoxin domain-containing protein [Gammaproteobacteria bacterium]MDH5388433.1 thioredoxin domain-containing protein [Gammaproteobacteria bacterium]